MLTGDEVEVECVASPRYCAITLFAPTDNELPATTMLAIAE
jgi:hypothetical protein